MGHNCDSLRMLSLPFIFLCKLCSEPENTLLSETMFLAQERHVESGWTVDIKLVYS